RSGAELRQPERREVEEGDRRRRQGEGRWQRARDDVAHEARRHGRHPDGEGRAQKNPNNNADMCRRKDVVETEPMVDMMWFEPATTETAPSAYYVPADA